VGVQLRPMRDDEYSAWLPQVRDGYAQSMIEEGRLYRSLGYEENAVAMSKTV
jgi:hypothetical protein